MKDDGLAYWGRFHLEPGPLEEVARRPDVIAMPRGEMFLAACASILRSGHGYVAATDNDVPKDGSGDWIPLFTYPCVEFLKQLDLSSKKVFEWGSGASTLFWLKRCAQVVSVENNRLWYERMMQVKAGNLRMILDETDGFPFRICDEPAQFDLIAIDGYGYRYDCAAQAIGRLAPGGMIVLDNAEWYPATAALLRGSGLIQVDFSGFKVTESHASTTSIFLSRDYDFLPLGDRQPGYCVGAKPLVSDWDVPYAKRP